MPDIILNGSELIVRYVGGSHIDPKTKKINGSAFERSQKDIDGISFTRRNVFCDETECDRKNIIEVMKSRITLGKTSCFAEIVVDDVLEKLHNVDGVLINFIEDPLPQNGKELANPAHALLKGFPFIGASIGSLTSELAGDLVRQCIKNQFSAHI